MMQIDPSAFRPLFATFNIRKPPKSLNHARMARCQFKLML